MTYIDTERRSVVSYRGVCVGVLCACVRACVRVCVRVCGACVCWRLPCEQPRAYIQAHGNSNKNINATEAGSLVGEVGERDSPAGSGERGAVEAKRARGGT